MMNDLGIDIEHSHIQHSVAGSSFGDFVNPLESEYREEAPQLSVVFHNKALTKITGLKHREEFDAFVD